MTTESSYLSTQEKISGGLSAIYDQQRQEHAIRNLLVKQIKDNPVDGVAAYMKVKDGEKSGLGPEAENFYKGLALGELYTLLDDALEENMKICEITEPHRYIHNKAAAEYDTAQLKLQYVMKAKATLAAWRQITPVTTWEGKPWRPNKKKNKGAK